MRDLTEIIDEFHAAGLISDDFVEKLAHDTARLAAAFKHVAKDFKKEAGWEAAIPALAGLAATFAPEIRAGAQAVKNWYAPPTMGQQMMSGLTSMMSNPLGQHLMMGGALGGAQMVKNVLTKAMDNMTMNSSYSQMLQQFPDLQKADPALVHRTFQVVQQYAPSVAKNPTVAGTFVKGILQYPDAAVTPEHVRSLVDVERQMNSMHQPGLLGEMASGAARTLGQSAVHTFAPDPMEERKLQLMEERERREAGAAPWQRAQQAASLFGQYKQYGQRERHHQDKMQRRNP